jgi:hypothetical protein
MKRCPCLVEMIANRDGVDRSEASKTFQVWRAMLECSLNVKISLRARASTCGHKNYLAGVFTRKLTIYGCEGVGPALDFVLDLLDEGGFDAN